MKKAFLITILGATSVMFGQVVPPGPWQTVASPVTIAGEVITSPTASAGVAYWNGDTYDSGSPLSATNGACLNIGCFVTGTGGWAGDPNSPNLVSPVYLGNANGSAIPDYYFAGQTGVPNSTTMLAEVAGKANNAWLGWYDPTLISSTASFNAGNRGTAWDIIFVGTDTTNATQVFTPSTNFGLFFFDYSSAGGVLTTAQILAGIQGTGVEQGAYFTESSAAAIAGQTDAGFQHFATFATSAAAAGVLPATFWVGVEDNKALSPDHDYNDMIIRLRIVPEPGYFVLLSLGLGGLGLVRSRFKKAA